MKREFSRQQKLTIVFGILSIALTLVILQLWLLTATMHAFLGGKQSVLIPAALASVVCFLLNASLLWYIYQLERP